ERVDPQPGEDLELAHEAERLGHAEDLRQAAQAAHDALIGTDDAEAPPGAAVLADLARRGLETVARHDVALEALARRLAEVGYVVADLGADLARYADEVQSDPGRLAAVQERRAALATLTRAHGGTVDDVL